MARVIRGDGAKVVPSEVVDAQAEAERILADARARAEAWVEGTRDRVRAEARAEARLEVEAVRRRRLAELEASLPALAVAIARRAVGEALAADPTRVRALVEEAVDRMRRAAWVKVRVHPDDADALAELSAEVVPDEALERGDCVVESDLGEVDASLDVRFGALRASLEGALDAPQTDPT